MNKTKIREDKHGLFVRVDSKIYRPIINKNSYTSYKIVAIAMALLHDEPVLMATSRDNNNSVFKDKDIVKVQHDPQGPHCKVEKNGILEYWHCHGWYVDTKTGKRIKSENVFTEPHIGK